MNTHHPAPSHHPKPELMIGYRVCPECGFQFTSKTPDQETCRLCATEMYYRKETYRQEPRLCALDGCGNIFKPVDYRHRYCSDKCSQRGQTIKKQERTIARGQRQCMICDRPFWARTPAAKICHKDECKAEGKRRNDAKRRAKAKRKEVA